MQKLLVGLSKNFRFFSIYANFISTNYKYLYKKIVKIYTNCKLPVFRINFLKLNFGNC